MAEIAEKQVPKRYQNKGLDELLAEDFWDFVPRDVQQQEPSKNKITLTPYQVTIVPSEQTLNFKTLGPYLVRANCSSQKRS
jgi:hypothetical protein